MNRTQQTIDITLVAVLSLVLVSMVLVFLFGLVSPRVKITPEDDKFLAILSPAFQTIVGWAVGRLGGRSVPTTNGDTPAKGA